MTKPTFPSIMPREHGLVVSIDKSDLPDTWPNLMIKIGGYILDACDTEPKAFRIAMQSLAEYLEKAYEAIEKYDEDFGDGSDRVPAWYEEIGACWTKDEDDSDCLVGILEQTVNRGCTTEVELKCNLLLTLFLAPWPDFIDEMCTQISEYMLIAK